MFISLYYISYHQLRVYNNNFIINHDVFRKVYILFRFLFLKPLFLSKIFYYHRHTIEMAGSYSCLRLDDSHVFSVEVYKNEKNQKYFEYNGKIVLFKRLTVGQLAKIILLQEEFKVSKLWKIDIDKNKLNPDSTDEDIKKLGGVSMGFEYDFIYYFPNDYEPTRNKIHIIAVVATTTTGKYLPMFYLSNKKFAVTKYRFGLIDFFLSAYAGKRKAEEEYNVIVPSKLYLFYYHLQQEDLIIFSRKGF
jgi:hypothetical protein